MKTAHATLNGVVVMMDDSKVLALAYGGNHHVFAGVEADNILEMLHDDEDSHLPKDITDTLENANYPGRTSNFGELKSAEVGYSVDDACTPFREETLSFMVNGEMVSVTLPDDLVGRYEAYNQETAEDADPLTVTEALWLIEKINNEDHSDVSTEAARRSVESYLVPALAEVGAKVASYLEGVDHLNQVKSLPVLVDGNYEPSQSKLVPRYIGLRRLYPEVTNEVVCDKMLADLCRRLAHTVRTNSVGGPWAYTSMYNTSEREGVTDIMEELAIKGASPQAQYLDDDIPDLDKAAREKNPHLFNQMYEVKLNNKGKVISEKQSKNLGWSDRSLYFYRKERDRNDIFHKLMAAVQTLSPQLLVKHFYGKNTDFQKKYRDSIRACSPGPLRRLVNGQWQNLPLTGKTAVEELVARGYKLEDLHPEVALHRGETWHNVFLTKAMKEEIDRALEIRLRSFNERLEERLARPLPAYTPRVRVERTAEDPFSHATA